MVPPPNDPSYHEATRCAGDRMRREVSLANFDSKHLKHRRGDNFAALHIGLSYGNGHTTPTHLNLGHFHNLANDLLGDRDIQQLALYQDGGSKTATRTTSDNISSFSYECTLASERLSLLQDKS